MNTVDDKATPRARTQPPRRKEHRRTHTAAFVIGGFLVWVYLAVVVLHLLRNEIIVPAWIFIGAALVPATLMWVMTHRLRTTDTVTASQLVFASVVGGTLALALGSTLDQLVGMIPQDHPNGGNGVVSLALAGFVEEFAKGLLIVVVGWKFAKSTRNGLFVGGSVGLGFAVLETMGYITEFYQGVHPLATSAFIAFERGITAPFGHVLWSSLLGAALFAGAARTGRFRLTWAVLGTYVGVALLHGAWDSTSPIVSALTGNAILAGFAEMGGAVVTILVGGLVWRHVARRSPAPPLPAAAPGSPTGASAPAVTL
ncbi:MULTISPECIES: PrsW family intramembrane metalloprotease [unclassified Microbacterium]|uniref:PrsW family intramembrane metalloprotease n=1 Tax=unclassified Microbacterium TaxID=2609290 RepID=UPI003019A310